MLHQAVRQGWHAPHAKAFGQRGAAHHALHQAMRRGATHGARCTRRRGRGAMHCTLHQEQKGVGWSRNAGAAAPQNLLPLISRSIISAFQTPGACGSVARAQAAISVHDQNRTSHTSQACLCLYPLPQVLKPVQCAAVPMTCSASVHGPKSTHTRWHTKQQHVCLVLPCLRPAHDASAVPVASARHFCIATQPLGGLAETCTALGYG